MSDVSLVPVAIQRQISLGLFLKFLPVNSKNVTEMLILLRWVLLWYQTFTIHMLKILFPVRNIRSIEDDPINQATVTDSRLQMDVNFRVDCEFKKRLRQSFFIRIRMLCTRMNAGEIKPGSAILH